MKKLIALFFLFLSVTASNAQFMQLNEEQLILETKFERAEFNKRKVNFLFAGSKSPVLKYNPVSLSLGSLMYFYQKVLSPQFSANCAFEISCSEFSKACIREFGFIKGVSLTADRLTRCNELLLIDLSKSDLNENMKIVDPLKNYRLKH